MKKEVFGVNTAEVKAEFGKLKEVYKKSGKKATLKEWGHKLDESFCGHNALIAKYLKVMFEEKSDEYINRVLEGKDPTTLLGGEIINFFYAKDPHEWDVQLMGYMVELAESWAVYNLPILQEVMDVLIERLDKNCDYLVNCCAVEDMLEDIKNNGGGYCVPSFQSYVSPYIVEYLKDYNLDGLIFQNDDEKVDLDYLKYVWKQFCNTALIEDILLDRYYSFMANAVRNVLSYANV